MTNEAPYKIKNDLVTFEGLRPGFVLRRVNYHSEKLADLKALSIASINIQASKFYMDSIRTATRSTDPHMFDAAILAAILKYGSVFKVDNHGKKIDPTKMFTKKLRIINRSIDARPIEIDDPELHYLDYHSFFMELRDKFIAHDDRIIGHTDCYATLDDALNCDQVMVLTQRSTVFSAIKPRLAQLPMCIDVVFTWLDAEKKRYCQIVADEINSLKPKVRRKFSAPIFPTYKGLSDAEERKQRSETIWTFNWATGKKEPRNIS